MLRFLFIGGLVAGGLTIGFGSLRAEFPIRWLALVVTPQSFAPTDGGVYVEILER